MSKFRFKINKTEEPEKKRNARAEEGDGASANELLRELLVSLGEDLPAEENAESADEALPESLPEISPEEMEKETLPTEEETPIRLYASEEDAPEEGLPEIPQTAEAQEAVRKPSVPAENTAHIIISACADRTGLSRCRRPIPKRWRKASAARRRM